MDSDRQNKMPGGDLRFLVLYHSEQPHFKRDHPTDISEVQQTRDLTDSGSVGLLMPVQVWQPRRQEGMCPQVSLYIQD